MSRSPILRFAPLVMALSVALAPRAQAQTPQVRQWRQANEHALLREYVDFVAIPNLASREADIRRNATHLAEMMRRRGLNPRLLESEGSPPAVYGEWTVPGATRTLVLYAHYDGQPTDSLAWHGSHPWRPVFRTARLDRGGQIVPLPAPGQPIDPEWRLYARSAADDKAGVMAILAAVDALRASGLAPTSNLKFFFEGEEEDGSPHLAALLRRHADVLRADAWIIADGPVHQSGHKQVSYGVRGDVNVDVTVYGPVRPLHSGHYGNWAPNPAMLLAQLLATMKDSHGRVSIAGWYDDVEPLGEAEREAIRNLPLNDAELMQELGVALPEISGPPLAELITLPSLNVNGFESGGIGAGARNVIPTEATAVLDLRLVRGNDHQRQVQKLVDHIRMMGFHLLEGEPTLDDRRRHPRLAWVRVRGGGYNAERTPMDLPVSRAVLQAVQSTTPAQPVYAVPTLGGSLPLSIISEALGTRTISVPLVNHDNNQHAEDENLRLQNLWDGIESMAAVMMMAPER
ncbi:M20/M25/M40 family metallo-hydrolase [Longimicrobium sp.]|uniref:M20/M25/M40 family metallo-hydrolase n=1 Tax=Longimicrobium sp. TaxID=2029185 RepID=UPI003B3A93CB